MKLKPNSEQQAIIDAAQDGACIAINAFAGTGKTTTLEMLAEALGKPGMYLAFNKMIKEDAQRSMPRSISCKTFHGLAFGAMRPDRDRLEARLNGRYIAAELNLPGFDLDDHFLAPDAIGDLVIETLRRYCSSADIELSVAHMPKLAGSEEISLEALEALEHMIVDAAESIWQRQCDTDSRIPITHDTYVKQWSLSDPVIPARLILFDEAQDASPVFIDIIERQRARGAQVVWVGDRHQQIYAWRGAVDALSKVDVDARLYLTKSYRFGTAIAERATDVLKTLREERPLIGAGGDEKDGSRAELCRTNGEALARYMSHLEEHGTDDILLIGADELLALCRGADSLMQGNPRGRFALFKNYSELVDHAQRDAGSDLAPLVRAIDSYGVDALIDELDKAYRRAKSQLASGQNAAVTISTVHRAKGREWDYVELAADWPTKVVNGERRARRLDDEERRLMYVALTRGRVEVDCRAVEEWLPQRSVTGNVGVTGNGTAQGEGGKEGVTGNGAAQSKGGKEGVTGNDPAKRVGAHRQRRQRAGMRRVETWLPQEVASWIASEAKRRGVDRGAIVAELVDQARTGTPGDGGFSSRARRGAGECVS